MKKIISLLCLLIIYQYAYGESKYRFTNLSVKDGLSQLHVNCIYQDHVGYVWMGTRNGLNQFNGNSFTVFQNHATDDNSISNSNITCMTEDTLGNLWIGTENGLNMMDNKRMGFVRYYISAPSRATNDKIISLAIAPNNTLWVGGLRNLYFFNRKANRLEPTHIRGIEGNTVNAIVATGNLLFVGTTKNGLVVYDCKLKQVTRMLNTRTKVCRLPSDYVKDIYIDRKKNIWIATYNNGVCVVRPGSKVVEVFDKSKGLSNNRTRCVRESPIGEIWVGTQGGLNVINPVTKRVTVYDKGEMGNRSNLSIFSILFDRMQTVWIGTYSGGVNYYNPYGHIFDYYNPSKALSKDIGVLGEAVEFNGKLYICSEGSGLISFNLQTHLFQQFVLPARPMSTTFKTIYLDNGRLLCGTDMGEVYAFNPLSHQFSLVYHSQGKSQSMIYCAIMQAS